LYLTIRGSAISSEEGKMRKEFRALLVAVLMSAQLAVLPNTPASPLHQPKIKTSPSRSRHS
jgi:hypothetical protein